MALMAWATAAGSSRPGKVTFRPTSAPRTLARVDRSYTYIANIANADSDPLSFSFDAKSDGMTVDDRGVVRWKPTGAQLGLNPVVLRVEDGRGGFDTQSFQIDVRSLDVNSPPAIISTPPQVGVVGQEYQYDLNAVDAFTRDFGVFTFTDKDLSIGQLSQCV